MKLKTGGGPFEAAAQIRGGTLSAIQFFLWIGSYHSEARSQILKYCEYVHVGNESSCNLEIDSHYSRASATVSRPFHLEQK